MNLYRHKRILRKTSEPNSRNTARHGDTSKLKYLVRRSDEQIKLLLDTRGTGFSAPNPHFPNNEDRVSFCRRQATVIVGKYKGEE